VTVRPTDPSWPAAPVTNIDPSSTVHLTSSRQATPSLYLNLNRGTLSPFPSEPDRWTSVSELYRETRRDNNTPLRSRAPEDNSGIHSLSDCQSRRVVWFSPTFRRDTLLSRGQTAILKPRDFWEDFQVGWNYWVGKHLHPIMRLHLSGSNSDTSLLSALYITVLRTTLGFGIRRSTINRGFSPISIHAIECQHVCSRANCIVEVLGGHRVKR
jgi:hypothetical protein